MPPAYDPSFLPAHAVGLPVADAAVAADLAPTREGATVRDCTHFSLAMSASRRLCRWTAWNVDGGSLLKLPRKGVAFQLDPAYEDRFQVGDELYAGNHLDRGHMARRSDLLWGPRADAEQANRDSFRFTNITPQLDAFNQSSQQGLWGELEDLLYEQIEVEELRLCLFAGPIFTEQDFAYRGIQVPRAFWKLVAWVERGELRAAAFVLTQEDLEQQLPSFGFEPFKLYQLPLTTLHARTGLTFGDLAAADTGAVERALTGTQARPIRSRAEVAPPPVRP